jgi:hypothetical protein
VTSEGTRILAVIAAIAGIAAAAGCSGGCRRGTPYVPFLEDSGATAQRDGDVTALDTGTDGGKVPAFQIVRATLAPPNTTKWSLEGLSFEAPGGTVVVAALAHDLDGDGQRDVAAYVQPPGGGGGEIRFYRGDGKGALQPSRGVVGSGAAGEISLPAPCLVKREPTLMTLVGPHTLAVDLRPVCGEAAPSQRRYAVAAFAPAPSIRCSARIAEPSPGWTLAVDVEALDRDGDGVDDPAFSFALEGGGPPYEPGERVVAKLRYWDRPAGLSRDRTEPEASFQYIAQVAAARATKKGTAIGVAAYVRRLRLLHASMCAEGGSASLEIGGERGLKCGPSRGLEEGGAAEIRSAVTLGDLFTASAARERLTLPSVTKTKKTREDVDKWILGAAPSIWGTTRDIKAIPSTPSKGAPAWGALSFEKSGALLVRTNTGVVRVDVSTMDESEANDVTSWGWEVVWPGKDIRLGGVVDACESPYLAARVTGHDVPTGAALLPLPMLPPMSSARCPEGKSASWGSTPVAWGASGLFVLVDHEPVIMPLELTTTSGARASGTLPAPGTRVEGAFVPGSPRSPGGGFLVTATRFGVVRRDEGAGANAFVRAKELEGLYGSLRECTVADGGARLACLREGKALIIDTTVSGSAAPSAAPSVSAQSM